MDTTAQAQLELHKQDSIAVSMCKEAFGDFAQPQLSLPRIVVLLDTASTISPVKMDAGHFRTTLPSRLLLNISEYRDHTPADV